MAPINHAHELRGKSEGGGGGKDPNERAPIRNDQQRRRDRSVPSPLPLPPRTFRSTRRTCTRACETHPPINESPSMSQSLMAWRGWMVRWLIVSPMITLRMLRIHYIIYSHTCVQRGRIARVTLRAARRVLARVCRVCGEGEDAARTCL